MSSVLMHFQPTVTAVATVVVSVAVGALAAPFIPNGPIAVRDLSVIVTAVCVPCLFLDHLSHSFHPAMLEVESALLIGFGYVGALVGGTLGHVVGRLTLEPTFAFLTAVGCAFQNTVVLPVGLLSSLDVPWLTPEMRSKAVAYVFVYNISTTTTLWTVGNWLIGTAAARARGEAPPAEPWSAKKVVKRVCATLWTAPFVATIVGIACGLARVRQRADALQYPLNAVFSAVSVVGSATVPTSLLLLGVNLRKSAAALRVAADTSAPEAEAPLARLVAIMAGVRLVIVPAVCMTLFHVAARQLVPSVAKNPALVLVLFIEVTSPTAIAITLLCNVHGYKAGDFSRALFFQYLAVVVTSALWLASTLAYMEKHVLPFTEAPAAA